MRVTEFEGLGNRPVQSELRHRLHGAHNNRIVVDRATMQSGRGKDCIHRFVESDIFEITGNLPLYRSIYKDVQAAPPGQFSDYLLDRGVAEAHVSYQFFSSKQFERATDLDLPDA